MDGHGNTQDLKNVLYEVNGELGDCLNEINNRFPSFCGDDKNVGRQKTEKRPSYRYGRKRILSRGSTLDKMYKLKKLKNLTVKNLVGFFNGTVKFSEMLKEERAECVVFLCALERVLDTLGLFSRKELRETASYMKPAFARLITKKSKAFFDAYKNKCSNGVFEENIQEFSKDAGDFFVAEYKIDTSFLKNFLLKYEKYLGEEYNLEFVPEIAKEIKDFVNKVNKI